MSLVKRNNLMFPSLIDEMFNPDWFGGTEKSNTTLPAVNIKETKTDYRLELAVPGKKKGDFNIEIDKEVLTISSQEGANEENTGKNIEEEYTRKEFSYASFKRTFSLGKTIDTDKIDAVYEDGILSFVLPKKEEALPKEKRSIELS